MTLQTLEEVTEIRCKCGKLLAKVSSTNIVNIKIEIKCPRCDLVNGALA